MGKSTISTGAFSRAMLVYQRVYLSIFWRSKTLRNPIEIRLLRFKDEHEKKRANWGFQGPFFCHGILTAIPWDLVKTNSNMQHRGFLYATAGWKIKDVLK